MRVIEQLKEYPKINNIFKLFKDEKNAVFLDSSLKNNLGNYSIIGLNPYLELVIGDKFTVNGEVCDKSYEEFIKEYIENNKDINDTSLPIVSGAIGYFSYDYGIERNGITTKHKKELDVPDSILCFYDVFIVEDLNENKLYLIANGKNKDSKTQIEELKKIIFEVKEYEENTNTYPQEVNSNFIKEDYLQAVSDMIDHIVEGDIYIANMTQQLRITSELNPYDFFEKLRKINPSPFGGYLNYEDFVIVSASPERFLQMQNSHIITRPIKGTRKRGSTPQEDMLLRQELLDSEKDKSELLMIVDLERNDLNKVCESGSVKVTELFAVEEYATVFHLVSTIEGQLKKNLSVIDLIQETFPGGSITGAPKYRAMEIIDKLEHSRRNIYTGSFGYITLDGDCDLNIVIRTTIYKDGVYHLGVGGGITCESELEFEYEETLQKAKAILNALS